MHPFIAMASATDPYADSLLGILTVLQGGALLPFLLSVIPDAVAYGLQRRRWRPLLGVIGVLAVASAGFVWTLSLVPASSAPGVSDRAALTGLLFEVGLVVAVACALPRVLRAVGRRRRDGAQAPVPLSA